MNDDYLIGKRFGYWTVIGVDKPKKYKNSQKTKLLCKCDCGTIKSVFKTLLINGKSTSCGCKGRYLKCGDKYNSWTVISKSDYTDNHGSQFYLCKCDCGSQRIVRMADLLNNSSEGCGHNRQTMSKGALSIYQLLTDLHKNFTTEFIFPDLPKLRFDFAVFGDDNQIVLLIEYDGEQHNLSSTSMWSTESLHKRDNLKNNYAIKNKIPLVRVPWNIVEVTENDIFSNKYLVTEDNINAFMDR